MPLVLSGLKIQGSLMAAKKIRGGMLDFASNTHIKPISETFSMSVEGVEEALKKPEEGRMR